MPDALRSRSVFPFVRLAKVLLMARRAPAIAPLEAARVSFRVWPGDLDQNRHLNNGRYLTLMDLGRFALMSRMGMIGPLMKRKWYPVVTSATIRYRRSIDAFQRYDLVTRMLAWDDEGFYLEQRFERNGRVLALGVIKGRFLGPEGKVAPKDLVDLVAPGTPSPPIPKWVELWSASQDALAEELRAAERAPES